jgi:hypothetical protein
MVWVIENILTFVELIIGVALADPLSIVLVALGAAIFTLSFGAFGYLSLRGLLTAVMPDVSSGGPPDARH